MTATHDMSVRHRVFTDLNTCAREENLVRYLLLRILPELAARMWRNITPSKDVKYDRYRKRSCHKEIYPDVGSQWFLVE
jgi:hypothetical protein